MKHLKRIFEKVWRYDEDSFLKFLYDLDSIGDEIRASYDGSECGSSFGYEFDETDDSLIVEFGYSGYSDGFSRTMKIFYNHYMGPTKVVSTESGSNPYGSWDDSETEEFDSYDEIIADIRGHLGL
jgi:hypothetical protein